MRGSAAWLFAACVSIWGTTWLAITFQLGRVPPEASVGWRFALASAVVFGLCLATGRTLRFPLRVHALLALLGLSMFCLSYLFVYHAETILVSGLVAVGYSASPLVNLAVSRIALGVPASGRLAAGGLLGMAGVALVFWPELARFPADGPALAGVALTAGAVVASSVGNVFATLVERRGLDVWQRMAWGMGYGAAGCLAAAGLRGERLDFEWTAAYVGSLAYLAVLGSVAAFAAYLTLLQRAGAARVGYVGVMVPIVALAVSGVFEGFRWGPLTVAGIAVAVAGNVLVLRRAEPSPAGGPRPPPTGADR
ncbi:MAG TPA: EamA family transporter [Anaeromyxobacteraceae bacterium]|nr:EamA family transporter [Anaeromyxobacteraceae bacterium]